MSLSPSEKQRYERHLMISSFGEDAQVKLKNSSVLVIGAGGLGSPVLRYLAAAGVGHIGIMDADVVEVHNLQRQILYDESMIGKSKAQMAAQSLQSLNSEIKVEYWSEFFNKDNALSRLEAFQIIVDCTDNAETRYLINDTAVTQQKPMVYGAIFEFTGQLSVFNYQGGPSYRCLFPEIAQVKPGKGVMGVLPAQIGSMQAGEVIKLITGVGEVCSGTLFSWDALNLKSTRLRIKPVPTNFEPGLRNDFYH